MVYRRKKTIDLKSYLKVGLIALAAVGILAVANFLIQRQIQLSALAATGNANIFFEPNTFSLPEISKVSVWATTDKALSFNRIELTFDKTLLKLNSEITFPNPVYARHIKYSSAADANSTGRVIITIAADPSTRGKEPTGNIQLATLEFVPLSTSPNLTTSINFDLAHSQLVDTSAIAFNLTGTKALLTLNPLPSPSPSPSVAASLAPSPVPSAGPDSEPPTVIINNPKNGATVTKGNININASASDASGIASLEIFLDGKSLANCTNKGSCSAKMNVNQLSVGSHQIKAKATDKSANHNWQETSVSITR